MSNEEKKYIELLNNAPNVVQSNGSVESEAALIQAENNDFAVDYNNTADGKLDAAINKYLNAKGFNYNTANDKDYQQLIQQSKINTGKGKEQSVQLANQFANGYTPTYANTVANEVSNNQLDNISDSASAFRQLAKNDYNAEQSQLAGAINIYNSQAEKDYSRHRDSVADNKNFLNYLYERYISDKQIDNQFSSINNEIYSAKLNSAQQNLNEARAYDNQKYLFNTQSAQSKAQIKQSEYENKQKLEYEKAKANAQKLKSSKNTTAENRGKTENANAVFAAMGLTEKDFEIKTNSKGEKTYGKALQGVKDPENGAVNYTVYAKNYIDEQYQKGNLNDDEKAYLYQKIGATSDGSNYNSELADGFINTFKLGEQKDKNKIASTIEMGYNMGNLSRADVAYCMAKFGITL